MVVQGTSNPFRSTRSITPRARAAVSDPRWVSATEAGCHIPRRYTQPGQDLWAMVEWDTRTALIADATGKAVFEQKDVEVPRPWSQTATQIVASKYFRGTLGTPERERSVKQLIGRVIDTLTAWGQRRGYFATAADAEAFRLELGYLLLTQRLAFNSPVWFNLGVEAHPQCSACFINSVEDSMESILGLARTEGMLFKYGSGTGSNLSAIRSSRELLKGGGTASGPVSFMKGFDAFAGVIKSGGKTRRAAKMVILNVAHPDIFDFVRCKSTEEKKAWSLIEAGYDGNFNVPGGAYDSVFFQNANHSVRVTDGFMRAVKEDKTWTTTEITSNRPAETFRARELWTEMAQAAHLCGDPGLQFDTTVNRWHTCKGTARINASNPCSEYMFLDDSACNLASLNLMRFRGTDGAFDVDGFRHACSLSILAQEILVDDSSYPTRAIEKNSHDYRPLGLGYANLGALLMAKGLPYDADEGRAYAAAITAIMTGTAYQASAEVARAKGPFAGYVRNRDSFLDVMGLHREHVDRIDASHAVPADLLDAARDAWDSAIELGEQYGYRNAQTTVLAPTGTIGFMMDCDTTGIEPDIALIKYKKLVGGGMMKIVNATVPEALQKLGYARPEQEAILKHLDDEETIEGAPFLKAEHVPVFDCAFKASRGTRTIAPMGHVRMMAAVQPFLSGAISKTVNMPTDSTAEDIAGIYEKAWELGLKAIAIYRDGSKRTQPLATGKAKARAEEPPVERQVVELVGPGAERRRLPDERRSVTHKFSIGGHEGYMTVGMYDDGSPGELFCVMSKEGSVVSGLMDAFATAVSLALQHGVPLKVLVDKFAHTRFEPSGFTGNPQVPIAKSVTDYIFRWMALKFLPVEDRPFDPSAQQQDMFAPVPHAAVVEKKADSTPPPSSAQEARRNQERTVFSLQADAPPCQFCGSIMVRNGACYKCLNCGTTSGCS
ncbi:MAG: vitamin B12-dependent ribonucleotide reductase [Deltaproteobacteria bacterium]|nr:vitamin B12-dependent ribonucleotide reductase [Deltaproteobacteria bacterium]